MTDLLEIAGNEQSIGDLSESTLFSKDKLLRYAAIARQDALDYEAMALRHRENAEAMAKRAVQRQSDADFYEKRIATLFPNQEAAE